MMIMVAAVVSKWLCSLSGELLDVLVGPPHWLSVVIMASSKSNSTDRGATIPKKQQKATHFVVTTSVLCSWMSWAYFCCCSSWHCELHLNSGTQGMKWKICVSVFEAFVWSKDRDIGQKETEARLKGLKIKFVFVCQSVVVLFAWLVSPRISNLEC